MIANHSAVAVAPLAVGSDWNAIPVAGSGVRVRTTDEGTVTATDATGAGVDHLRGAESHRDAAVVAEAEVETRVAAVNDGN